EGHGGAGAASRFLSTVAAESAGGCYRRMRWDRIGKAAQFRTRQTPAFPCVFLGMSTWWRSFVSAVRRSGERSRRRSRVDLAPRIGDVFQEFQILLGDEEAREDFIAAPFEKQRLTRKR